MESNEIPPGITDFFESYRRAFEEMDSVAVANHFSFPWQLAGDTGDAVELHVVADRAEALPLLERLLGGYGRIGVATARVEELRAWPVSSRLVQAFIHWRLLNAEGKSLYDFHAGYTLAKSEPGWTIVAIAHDEIGQSREYLTRA